MSTIAFADRQVIRPAAVITTSTLSTAVWAPRHTTERYIPTCLFASRLQLSSLHAPSARRTPRPPALGRSPTHLPQVHIELPHPGCSIPVAPAGRDAVQRAGEVLSYSDRILEHQGLSLSTRSHERPAPLVVDIVRRLCPSPSRRNSARPGQSHLTNPSSCRTSVEPQVTMSSEKEKAEISTVTATSTGISTGGEGVLTGIKVKREGSVVRMRPRPLPVSLLTRPRPTFRTLTTSSATMSNSTLQLLCECAQRMADTLQ